MEEQKQPLFQNALRWGLILGAVSIALTAIAYAVDYSLFADLKFGLISFAIIIGITVYAGISYRKQIGGFIYFKNAFLHAFLTLAISGLLSTVFSIVLYSVVDPELPQKVADASIESTQKMMEKFGMPEDQLEKALEDARKDMEGRYTPIGLVKTYIWVVVGFAVFALIVGLIVRRKQPEEFS